MFKQKPKPKKPSTIIITDKDIIKYSGKISDIPMVEEEIIKGSIEFYNDPHPCMIHKSAVISRYHMQLIELIDLNNTKQEPKLDISDIPKELYIKFNL